VQFSRIVVWEAFDANDAMTQAAASLYEKTLAADERIPWYWIEKSVESRTKTKPGQPGGWTKHLLLAAPEGRTDDPAGLAGYVYGALIPNYGGYLCYIGVADWARRMGVGTRLFDQFFRQMAVDAGELGSQLPFVIWESHRPGPLAPATEWDIWAARTKLFDRAGGLWVEGVDFLSPNFAADDETVEPVSRGCTIRCTTASRATCSSTAPCRRTASRACAPRSSRASSNRPRCDGSNGPQMTRISAQMKSDQIDLS
jgi:hypothetical protein